MRIPATIEEAKAQLNGIGALLTAKEWERAAIVYAFTEPQAGARTDLAQNRARLTFDQFAALGISGLSGRNTVAAYRKAWAATGLPAEPGADIELPDLPWKEYFGEQTVDVQERVFKQVLRDPERFERAVSEPDVAELAAERVTSAPQTRWRTEDRLTDIRDSEREERYRAPVERSPADVIERVIRAAESFFDTTVEHNGRVITYRQVIEIVQANPDAVLRAAGVPTAELTVALGRALDKLAAEARALAEPLQLTAGDRE